MVIVNEVGARALFGKRNPIGQMVQWGDTVGPSNPYCRVVGVVGDVKHEGAERDAIELYYPFTQWPVGGGYYVLRTRLDQTAVSSAIREAISKEDRNAAIVSIQSHDGTNRRRAVAGAGYMGGSVFGCLRRWRCCWPASGCTDC